MNGFVRIMLGLFTLIGFIVLCFTVIAIWGKDYPQPVRQLPVVTNSIVYNTMG